jgi:putative addiction module CopG family antidote
MQIPLKPELEKFVDEQVRTGRFPSASAVIEAGLSRLMLDPEPNPIDEQTLASLERAEEQIDRGQYRDWSEVSVELRKKYLGQ